MDVDMLADMENHGVRIAKCLIVRGAYYYASFFEINLVHNYCYLCTPDAKIKKIQ